MGLQSRARLVCRHRLEAYAGVGFLELKEFHIESCIMRHQHGVVLTDEGFKLRQYRLDRWVILYLLIGNTVKTSGSPGNMPAGIDQTLEGFTFQDASVNDAHAGDLNDFIAF